MARPPNPKPVEWESGLAAGFPRLWHLSTADSNLTLHGFRRFKTAHLLSLRHPEQQTAKLDHELYQAGLSLDLELSPEDCLGLESCARDENVTPQQGTVTGGRFAMLRDLLQQYGEANELLRGPYTDLTLRRCGPDQLQYAQVNGNILLGR